MPTVAEVSSFLQEFAPVALAESWDNVGLLLGRRTTSVRRVMTCLTLTADVCAEAVAAGVTMIVTHHPILFRGTKSITDGTEEGRLVLSLIEHGIAVYSPHTAFDSTSGGINQFLAERLKLVRIQPLKPAVSGKAADGTAADGTAADGTAADGTAADGTAADGTAADGTAADGTAAELVSDVGVGRCGELWGDYSYRQLLGEVRRVVGAGWMEYCGDVSEAVKKVGIGCGAGEGFLDDALKLGCDVFLTGEARFHTVLHARACGMKLILVGHYWSERPAVEMLAARLAAQFPGIDVWASGAEHSPLQLWQ